MAERALTEAELAARIESMAGWYVEEAMLRRRYETDGWPTTVMLVNAIAFLAEAADHHPDLLVQWGSVQVGLSTHSAGGITGKDVALAQEIDELAAKWAKVKGHEG